MHKVTFKIETFKTISERSVEQIRKKQYYRRRWICLFDIEWKIKEKNKQGWISKGYITKINFIKGIIYALVGINKRKCLSLTSKDLR